MRKRTKRLFSIIIIIAIALMTIIGLSDLIFTLKPVDVQNSNQAQGK